MPPPPAAIADVGGGPGAYALAFANEGYEVQLLDPIELHVQQARAASADLDDRHRVHAEVGDACNLPLADTSVDVVLLFGPLYHLTALDDRRRALNEARRVLRSSGVLAVAAISRFASTYDGLARGFLVDPTFESIVERDLAESQHRNPSQRPEWFTTAYFHRPEELREEVAGAGFAIDALVGIEGPGSWMSDINEWLDDPVRRVTMLDAIRRVESEMSVIGASTHILAMAHTTD